ncbi:MAG: iron-containing alcohol dehydrogenase [Candidatus Altiarchaeota archaeon]
MPTRMVFGCDSLSQLDGIVRPFEPGKILLVTGGSAMKKLRVTDRIVSLLGDYDVSVFDGVESNPSVETVDSATKEASDCNMIIGLGGGSVLDAGKVIALLAVNGGSASGCLTGRKVEKKGLPFIAVPTTSGTGSEVTGISVLTDKKIKNKESFRSDLIYPDVALVDPMLTVTMPPKVTAASGLDALTHAFESYVSKKASPITEAFSLASAQIVWDNILEAYNEGSNVTARANMSLGSMLAGLAFSNCGCGACHGISYPLTFDFGVEHGIACAILLPHIIRFNMDASGKKYERLAKTVGLKSASDLIRETAQLCESLGVPKLSEVGVKPDDIPKIIDKSFSGSMKCNPREATKENLTELLKRMIR